MKHYPSTSSSEHWITVQNKHLSFFNPSTESDSSSVSTTCLVASSGDDNDSQNHHSQNTFRSIFILPFPVVYRTLSFLEVKDIVGSFYPTCRGFAEIVQSLSYSFWYDRLFDTMFPNPLKPLLMMQQQQQQQENNNTNSHNKHEKLQELLRERALTQLHEAGEKFIISQQQEQQKTKEQESETRKKPPVIFSKFQIAQLCHYFQTQISCSACHFPTKENFEVKTPQKVFLKDQALETEIDKWCTKHAQITAFVLKGSSRSSESEGKKNSENNTSLHHYDSSAIIINNNKSAKAIKKLENRNQMLDSIITPFSWSKLLTEKDRLVGVGADSSLSTATTSVDKNKTNNFVTPKTTFMNTCRLCKKQHQIPISNFGDVDPVASILYVADEEEENENEGTDDENKDNNDNTNSSTPAAHQEDEETFAPIRIHANNRNEETLKLMRHDKHDDGMIPTLLHEAEYWALINGSVIIKPLQYTFHGEKRTSTFSRLTNPITCRSIELRSFFHYRADSFPRFHCVILAHFHGMKSNNYHPAMDQNTKNDSDDDDDIDLESSASDENNGDDLISSSDDDENNSESLSSDITSSDDDDDDDGENNFGDKKKKPKTKKKNRGLLQLDSTRPLAELQKRIEKERRKQQRQRDREVEKEKQEKRRAERRLRRADKRLGFPVIRNELEKTQDKNSDQVRELFFAGFGRVEVDRPPRIKMSTLKELSQHLGLSQDFPMFLLWNAIVHSVAFAVDYLPFVADMRVMHRAAIKRMFDEAVVN